MLRSSRHCRVKVSCEDRTLMSAIEVPRSIGARELHQTASAVLETAPGKVPTWYGACQPLQNCLQLYLPLDYTGPPRINSASHREAGCINVNHPFKTVYLPLDYSGNSGVNGSVSHGCPLAPSPTRVVLSVGHHILYGAKTS